MGKTKLGPCACYCSRAWGLSLAEAEDAVTAIKKVRFRLILANDYRVEVASDRQTNPVDQPQFLQVARAAGNIKNRLNQQEVAFDYGLPTASQIYGVTAEMRDWYGFDFYGELNVSTRYRKYPTTTLKKHKAIAGIVGRPARRGLHGQLGAGHRPLALFSRRLRHGRRIQHQRAASGRPRLG